ncbi:glycosyltransferase [Desulfocurvibacter africanus]|uniref:glycosyltransferase n=1 Tax=Desulfocurvibacter africanus TaxID=873 RepID=UPI002FDA4D7C
MRIAWIGWHKLRDDVARTRGMELCYIRPPVDRGPMTWPDVLEHTGWTPDLLVYADASMSPPLVGLESFPCPTLFLCIDSHIQHWYPIYAQAFDLCTVSLRDHLPRFGLRLGVDKLRWLPPTPNPGDASADEVKEWDLLFVGNVNPQTMPGRHAFLAEVARLFPSLHVTHGAYRTFYPRARLVLNVAERGDLNFRVFEALGCGSCLLTPAIEHGQEELFRNGRELFTYPLGDAAGLVRLAERLLADEPLCRRVSAAGLAAVDARHRPQHRARELLDWLAGFDLPALAAERLRQARTIHKNFLRPIFLHWAEALDGSELARIFLNAAKRRPR